MAKLSGIVLAAGFSSRMGFPKALLEIGGETFLGSICRKLKIVCEEIIVVVGFQSERIIPRIKLDAAKIVLNRNFNKGMLSSLKKALENISPESEGFFLNPVDYPAVKEETYRRIVREWSSQKHKIMIPAYRGRRGHPPIFPRSYISKILNLPDDINGGVRAVFPKRDKGILTIETNDKGVIIDIDTPEEYSRMKKIEAK